MHALGNTRLGERMEPLLPNLAAGQRAGAVSPEQVRIVERVMRKPPVPTLKTTFRTYRTNVREFARYRASPTTSHSCRTSEHIYGC